MAVYERSVRVAASLETVWDFHQRIAGLEALTPGFANLRIESVTGPDGGADPDVLRAGSEVVASVRPFGVGPRQRWTSHIVSRDNQGDRAQFRDVMLEGPFERWSHTHRFVADGEATLVTDRVEYALPLGPAASVLDPLAVVGLEPMFAYRHRKTKELLEQRQTAAATAPASR